MPETQSYDDAKARRDATYQSYLLGLLVGVVKNLSRDIVVEDSVPEQGWFTFLTPSGKTRVEITVRSF